MFQRNEFRAALARKDMTIETIAKALDISTSAVSRKMNGRSDFFFATKLKKSLNC